MSHLCKVRLLAFLPREKLHQAIFPRESLGKKKSFMVLTPAFVVVVVTCTKILFLYIFLLHLSSAVSTEFCTTNICIAVISRGLYCKTFDGPNIFSIVVS